MMIGALLTTCGCTLCDSSLPVLPAEYTALYKGFTANTGLTYDNVNETTLNVEPLYNSQTFARGFTCRNGQSLLTIAARNCLKIDPDYLSWSPSFPPVYEDEIVSLNVDSYTKFSLQWNLVSEFTESTTGGLARAETNTLLVTGGIPISRNVYVFTTSGPTATNNIPNITFDTYEEEDCCCLSGFDCEQKSFASVTGGSYVNRTPSFSSGTYGTLNLKYVGKTSNTTNAFTVNLADNIANNARSWQASVGVSGINLFASDGNSTGFLTGSLTSVANNIAGNSTWFSSVTLNGLLALSGATTVAETSDLPAWNSFSVQRGVNGTSISIPLAFRGSISAPSTYNCGIFTNSGATYFATNFNDVVGTFSYTNDEAGFLTYLIEPRYPKHTSGFVANDTNRGLYYRGEFDSWIQLSESLGWSRTVGNSVVTSLYGVPTLGFTLRFFDLEYNECYYVGDEPVTGFTCDNDLGAENGVGPEGICPSNGYWLTNVYPFALPSVPGLLDCDGNDVAAECGPCPFVPCLSPLTEICICGTGGEETTAYVATSRNATQTLSGIWHLT
jgi:hypothetical protein